MANEVLKMRLEHIEADIKAIEEKSLGDYRIYILGVVEDVRRQMALIWEESETKLRDVLEEALNLKKAKSGRRNT